MKIFNTPHTLLSVAIGLCLPMAASLTPAMAEEPLDYNRDIRPIISDKCFACHGPDDKTRKKELRFDLEEGFLAKTSNGKAVIDPGNPGSSEFFHRITTEDLDDRMPPAESPLQLTDDDIALIKRWIAEGAQWQGHWAFIPPTKPALPNVSDSTWANNEIDYFVLSKLEKENLHPNKRAPKNTLIRRLSLDLTGLPPTPTEVDAFLADTSDTAYETLVDRLLDSPHYGERMAFPWLDAARYSDTNGYQRDTKRTMYPWRDWVINAFNSNMPYDQFTIEQLAGDLLPGSTLSQKIATGFNRNHRINGEGGIIPEEYAVEYVVDRVSTTSTTFMGLTMACARCHTHKFDPITQKEFFQFYSFFNNVPENGKGNERGNDKPFIQVPSPEDDKAKAALQTKIDTLKLSILGPDERLDTLQLAWEEELRDTFATLKWDIITPASVSAEHGTQLEILDDNSIFASGENPNQQVYSVNFEAPDTIRSFKLEILLDDRLPQRGPGRSPNGNIVLSDVEITRTSANGKTEELKLTHALADFVQDLNRYHVKRAIDKNQKSGWATGSHERRENREAIFVLDESTPIKPGDQITVQLKHLSDITQHTLGRFRLSHASSGDIAKWSTPDLDEWHYLGPIPDEKTSNNKLISKVYSPETEFDTSKKYGSEQVSWTKRSDWKDGSLAQFKTNVKGIHYLRRTINLDIPSTVSFSLGSNDSIKFWIDGEALLEKDVGRGAQKDQEKVTVFLNKGKHTILMKIANYGAGSGFYFALKNDAGQSILALMDQLEKPADQRDEKTVQQLRNVYRARDPQWAKQYETIKPLEEEMDKLNKKIVTTMIMEEMDEPRETYLLTRGEYDKPDKSEQLFPGVPASLGAMDESLPKNRLGLAKWLVSPDHPLTARVRVNHYWQQYFGKGLVQTSEDFGTQGMPPTHPRLLDWLAVHFVESGWDVKAMQKLIVMSATYQQSSIIDDKHLEVDPENILLARAPRFRLQAEMIRDQALTVSGLLNDTVGGPSVKPYQPDKMWSALTFQNMDEFDTNFYRQDTGDKVYRRGLYTFWKRTILPPRMQIFDAAGREACSMRNDATNTPMQAMVLLNDPTFIEAARRLAERMINEGGDTSANRIRYGYKLALAYDPDLERQQVLLGGLSDYQSHFNRNQEEAQQFINVGESTPDPTIPQSELAAYTMLASVMLNLDEAITRE